MTKLFSLASLLCLVTASFLTAQTPAIELKLQLLPDGASWGVFAKPTDGISPSSLTITGSAQVTVVMPLGFQWSNLQNHAGIWTQNADAASPPENPDFHYWSFVLLIDNPQIVYAANTETLLFTFKGVSTCPDTMYLIDNATDPFAQLPNSANNSPGNEFSVIDFGTTGTPIYNYSNNYAPSAWSCHDNDNDGILNAHEDTNGNGAYDPGIDESDLNAPNIAPVQSLHLKLQLLEDGETYGVFVKPDATISPTLTTITGSAQVTVVAPMDFQWSNLQSHGGTWTQNSGMENPIENPGFQYWSFGLVIDNPQIQYVSGEETLLFTFEKNGPCPDTMYIIDNETDPFAQLPNSIFSNPGNEFSVIDFGTSDPSIYWYSSNYAPSAWSCHDCDGDGTPNALEDSNGDGQWTPGTDASPLCGCPGFAFAESPQDVTVCDGGVAVFSVETESQGAVSFQWQMSQDGTNWTDLAESGDYAGVNSETLTVAAMPGQDGMRFRLVASEAGCSDFTNAATLTVGNPVSIVTQPVNLATCAGGAASFSIDVENLSGSDDLEYVWEMSATGQSWFEINEVAPFSGVNTATVQISSVSGLYDYRFRCNIKAPDCDWVVSEPAKLTVQGPVNFMQQPEDGAVCPGFGHTFEAPVANIGSGDVLYQWQVSEDGGDTWTDLSENEPTGSGGKYTGTATYSLHVNQTEGLDGNLYRVFASTGACELTSETAQVETDEAICQTYGCTEMKLQVLPNKTGWSVKIRPSQGFQPWGSKLLSTGRVTVVAPEDFTYQNLKSKVGVWEPAGTIEDVPGHPGMKYFTFQLQSAGPLTLLYGKETTLFTFQHKAGCPDTLYLMEGPGPGGLFPNRLAGGGIFDLQNQPFYLCGVYGRNAWRCNTGAVATNDNVGGNLLADTGVQTTQPEAVEMGLDEKSSAAEGGEWFGLAPNPAGLWTDIFIKNDLPQGMATLHLVNLQGQRLRIENVSVTGRHRLDLGDLPGGIYLVVLEVEGKVVQREKLVKY